MLKKYYLILLALLPICVYAQNATAFKAKKPSFSYAGYEKKVPIAKIKSFIQANLPEFPAYTDPEQHSHTLNELYEQVHFIDLNNDGLPEIIFEGQSGGEGTIVKIFTQSKNSYKKVFEERQAVKRLAFENKKLAEITVADNGCCDDYVTFEERFVVSFANDKPAFKKIKQVAFIGEGVLPDSLFTRPFAFTILNNDYNFRATPFIDDNSFTQWNDKVARGNVIGRFSKGTICTALGKKIDGTGREWWYIETKTDCTINASAFYDSEDNYPTNKRGWVSSRFVQALPEESIVR